VPLPEAGTREIADVTAALGHLDEALRTSEGRQRRFLLSVSHELRTPLTTLRGYADALADGDVDADEMTEVGETLRAEAQRLERYVADLLALARVEADDFSLEVAPVDLAEVVAAAVAAWTPRGASRGVAVEAEVAGPVVAETDGHRVRQVLDALVDNAVRVCDEGGRVVVAVRPAAAGVLLEVRDSGPGLTPEDAAVAFEPGVLHERYAGRAGGAGLGLALVDRLVTRLGGRVSVGPAPEGGASFTVHLP
jgi:two-component system sensor histidine kinase BaeS